MRREIMITLTTLAAVGCGLMGGIFFAFSNFVMRALSLQSADSGIRTMQSINVQIVNPLFLVVFVGTPLLAMLLAIVSARSLSQPGSKLLFVGSIVYLFGALATTVFINIPLNDRLAKMDATSLEASRAWSTYLAQWVRWNHVRAVAAVLGTGLLIAAVTQLSSRSN